MHRRGARLHSLIALVVVVGGLAAGCSNGLSSSSTRTTAHPAASTTTSSAATTSTTMAMTTSTADAGTLQVSIEGLPDDLLRASVAYTFHVVLHDASTAPIDGVAPVFQVVAQPCNCIQGSLERQDPTTGAWAPTPMPEGDGYDPASVATGPVSVPAGGSTTVALRLRVALTTAPKIATAQAFAVDVATHARIGTPAAQTVWILP